MAIKIIVKGQVQGVFFRDFVKKTADNLEIKGTVKNLPDGTVEIIAQGTDAALRSLVKACMKGTARAQVDDVTTMIIEDKKYSSFEIEY